MSPTEDKAFFSPLSHLEGEKISELSHSTDFDRDGESNELNVTDILPQISKLKNKNRG